MTIKRRIDTSKLRRPLKRSKITESVYGSLFVYLKFFALWILVLTADFLLEFRFEYLWPFWLLVRSAYDSFKYQGLVFSILFLTLALCSDVVCLMVLPIHWLFFAASTYVWVQFVWHTDKGLGLPTISMWLLFIYVEASVRLKELKNLPFHLDLCRPFAAHCIGYPVVTLGYGVKSYVGYKIRQRKIQQVSKENEFYMELINQSLPPEQFDNNKGNASDKITDDTCSPARKISYQGLTNGLSVKSALELLYDKNTKQNTQHKSNGASSSSTASKRYNEDHNLNELENRLLVEQEEKLPNGSGVRSSTNNSTKKTVLLTQQNGKPLEQQEDSDSGESSNTSTSSNSPSNKKDLRNNKSQDGKTRSVMGDVNSVLLTHLKDEKNARRRLEISLNQTENDLKKVKSELQSSRHNENDIRSQIHSFTSNERSLKAEVHQLKNDNEIYQQKIQAMSTSRQQDRSNIATLERKLKSERDARQLAETQLREERKKAKADESANRRDDSVVHEQCTTRRVELEEELKQLREKVQEKSERIKELENEVEDLNAKPKEQDSIQLKKETEVLMTALAAIQGKNTHLENSLSSETRLKLDLFSALGETRRRLEISQNQVANKDQEIQSLKAKIVEVMSVMPLSSNGDASQVYAGHAISPTLGGGGGGTTSDHEEVTNGPVYIPQPKNGLM